MTMNILIIDNDPSTLKLLKALKLDKELTFHHEPSGAKGLERANEEKTDLIVLSVELKDINGFMVCKKLRESATLKRIPVIVVSAAVGEKEFQQHKKLKTRADVYLTKPLDGRELISIMGQLLAIDISVEEMEEEEDLDLGHLLIDSDIDDISLDESEDLDEEDDDQSELIRDLKAQLENQGYQIEYYKKELDASKMYFSQMKGKPSGDDVELKKKDQEIERISFELKELQLEMTKYQDKLLEEDQIKKDLLSGKENAEQEKETLAARLEQESDRIEELEGIIEKLSLQIEKLSETSAGEKKEQIGLETRSQTLEADLYKTQEIVDDLNEKLAEKENVTKTREIAFHDEIKELETALENARHTNQQVEEHLMDRESEIISLKEALKALQIEKTEAENQSRDHEKEIHRLQREHQENQRRLSEEFQEKNDEARSALEKELQTQMDELQASFDKRISELDQKLTESDLENEGLKRHIEEALNEKHEREEHFQNEIREFQSKFQEEREALQAKIEENKQASLEMKVALRESAESNEELKNDLKGILEERTEFLIEISKLKEAEAALIRKNDEEIRALEKSHAGLVEEFDVKLKQAYSLQAELCQQRDLLKAEIVEHENQAQKLNELFQHQELKYQGDMENLEKRNAKIIADQEGQIEVARNQIKDLKEKADLLIVKDKEVLKLKTRVNQLDLGHKTLKNRLERTESILEEGLKALKGESEALDFEE